MPKMRDFAWPQGLATNLGHTHLCATCFLWLVFSHFGPLKNTFIKVIEDGALPKEMNGSLIKPIILSPAITTKAGLLTTVRRPSGKVKRL